MSCFHPVDAWQRLDGGPLFFGAERANHRHVQVPCNKCLGCREEYARQWAVRCMHESMMHKDSCFVTLTYGERNAQASLDYSHFQLFIDRLRKRVGPVRYFAAGEYGEASGRPHFHTCLFGWSPGDLLPWAKSARGHQMYRSRELESLWRAGFSTVQPFTFGTAKYCAKYASKSLRKDPVVDVVTGELRPPEFVHMSTKPGIGFAWLQKHYPEVYEARDGAICQAGGVSAKAPRYYDRQFEKMDAGAFGWVQYQRELRAKKLAEDNTPERLLVREKVLQARLEFQAGEGL